MQMNVLERANRAFIVDYTNNVHTYETRKHFYDTLQTTRPLTQPDTTSPSQRDSNKLSLSFE